MTQRARKPSAAPRPDLPRPRTTFIGRDADLAEIRRLVEEGAQLVSLLGPPGIGKTRLALHAARALGGDATFCDISDARDAASLLTAAALALGASIEAPMSTDALTALVGRALDQRGETLLVLDNAEQVAEAAAAAVARWMDAAPSALFLVTSRERLRIDGEHALPLAPLRAPQAGEAAPERILECDAVALLVDRARAARRAGAFTPDDCAALAEIARRADGVPLALELCAARLGMLEPRQLLARLERQLDVLTSDRRGALDRQATLRGAIDWSWDLLDERERSVLAQCSVFRGGFDLDAAEAVLEVTPPGPSALDVLTALHDKSLLAVDEAAAGARRCRLYESIRAYAAEKLERTGDAPRAEQRHARRFAEAGARWAAAARGRGFLEGLAALGRESENLLAARERSLRAGDLERALEITLCLEPLAIVRGPVLPYIALLEATLAEALGRVSPALAARGLGSLGVAESRRGRPAEAVTAFERAVESAEQSGDPSSLPFLLSKLANQRCALGEIDAAEEGLRRARELLDRRDDPAARGVYCRHRAFLLWRSGRVEEARRAGEEARALLTEHGDRRELAYVLCDLAASYLDAAELDAAAGALSQAVELLKLLQYRRVEGRALLLLALAHREAERFEEARRALERARAMHVEDGDREAEGYALWHLACLALEQDDAASARSLGEQALERYTEAGDRHLIAHARMVLGAARARLGEAAAADDELGRAEALLRGGAPQVLSALALFRAAAAVARDASGERADARREASSALAALAEGGTPAASVRFARRVLLRALASRPGAPAAEVHLPRRSRAIEAALVVSDDGRWFRLSERREVNLERRAALRRILAALARQRIEAPGVALTLDEVLEAGWPGERVSVEAGAARVYNAIQRLRRLGLEGVLRTRDDGYLLDVETSTRLAEAADRF